MGKFLDKKKQVMDIRLTSFGKNQLAEGILKPEFYAFFDDNIIYDKSYIASGSSDYVPENQNNIVKRIKNETQYLNTQVLFEDVHDLLQYQGQLVIEESFNDEDYSVKFLSDYEPADYKPRKDTFRFEQMIGDAQLDSKTQNIPSWKLVTLQGKISGTYEKSLSGSNGFQKDLEIPQIDVDLIYSLKVRDNNTFDLISDQDLMNTENISITKFFDDGRYVELETNDLVFYLEEENTILLNENFDVEVFELTGSSENVLKRKTFDEEFRKLNGNFITEDYINNYNNVFLNHDPTNVEYYFNLFKDSKVDKSIACKGIQTYNKQSYYIDIDFNCGDTSGFDNVYNDIYGPVTEPELCQ